MLERLSLKEFLRQAIVSKQNGRGPDAQSIIAPFEYANLSLSIEGIGGLIPGHAFQVDYMPIKFNKTVYSEGGKDVGPSALFTIKTHTQNISDAGWTTEIVGQLVNNPDAQAVTSRMSQEKLREYFSLNARRSFGLADENPLFSKVSKFINTAGRFLVGAKSYIDENYGNTADGFSLNKYAKNQGIAKAIADAETEDERAQIIQSLDVDIETIGDYEGGFFRNVYEIGKLTTQVGVAATGATLRGGATIAGGAAGGLKDTALRLDRDPVGIYPEWFVGGKATESETVVEETGKTDKGLLPNGAASGGNVDPNKSVSDDVILGDEIAKTNDKQKVAKREEEVAKATGKEIPIESIIQKISFVVTNQSSTDSAVAGQINVTTLMQATYKGEVFVGKRVLTGEGTLTKVGNENQQLLKKELAQKIKEKFPDIGMEVDAQVAKEEVPPPPYLGTTKDDAPFGDREPKWDKAIDARAALANKYDKFFEGSGYTAYRTAFGRDERDKHWADSPELWIKN
tara:strand:- start:54 stop:1592 length:1539 start_codon:yes stop_codon:yes gene_type:complete